MRKRSRFHHVFLRMSLLAALTIAAPCMAWAVCDYQPDEVGCPCFWDAGVWDPGGPYIQDVAQATFGTEESCPCPDPADPTCDWDPDPADPDVNFRDAGKPYYQMVLGCNEPLLQFWHGQWREALD